MKVYHEFLSDVVSSALREAMRRDAGLRVGAVISSGLVGGRTHFYNVKRGA